MESRNVHITNYLDWYTTQEKPGYAVFIEGQWGSGKTYAIKDWREKHKYKKDILYVSLYGLEKTTQIDSQLLMSNFTELEGRWEKIGGKVRVSVKILSESFKQILDKKYDITLPDLGFGELLGVIDLSGKTIIFDDLERQTIGLEQLMGYINVFVEHKNAKVIIIGDETKLNELSAIKEKTIGNTLHFTAEYEIVINILIDNLNSDKIKDFLKSHRAIIDDTFVSSKLNNLRILKQSLSEFERFFENFTGDLSVNQDFQGDILSMFLIFSFEIKQGKIQNIKDEFPIILKRYYGEILDSSEKTPEIKKSILEKYPGFDLLIGVLINQRIWIEFFEKGIISQDLIQKENNESGYLAKTPDWYKLWRYRELEDNELNPLFEKIKDDLLNNRTENIFEVVQICCGILYLNSLGMLDLDASEIMEIGKANINNLRKQLTPEFLSRNQANRDSSLGYVYLGLELDSVKVLISYLKDATKDEEMEFYKLEGVNMLALMKNNEIKQVYEMLAYKYFNNPMLSYIDPRDFLKAFNSIKNERKGLLIEGLENRFKGNFDSHISELVFLKGFHNELERYRLGLSSKSISSLYINRLIEVLDYIIKQIDNI